jgi:NTP pyrophosphatase (non-canonical NTP hydrolase)
MDPDLQKKIIIFREERNWRQFHNPKDLAISISLEAAELLENFQWSSSEEAVETKMAEISDELADVIILSVLMADAIDVDIDEIVSRKLEKNAAKYPVDKAFGNKKKYTELQDNLSPKAV